MVFALSGATTRNQTENAGDSADFFDGASGTIEVLATDKAVPDLRAKGRLQYIGAHHLRFPESGGWFMKCGTDAPEDLLAYDDFDAMPASEDEENPGSWLVFRGHSSSSGGPTLADANCRRQIRSTVGMIYQVQSARFHAQTLSAPACTANQPPRIGISQIGMRAAFVSVKIRLLPHT